MQSVLKSVFKKTKSIMINIKLTKSEKKMIELKANRYANGNVSEWIRYAAINLDPKESDLVSVKTDEK